MSDSQATLRLKSSVMAWPSADFREVLKRELEGLEAGLLPLQQAVSRGSYVAEEKFEVMILDVSDGQERLRVRAGVFYSSMIAGCNCADDPSPVDTLPEHCLIQLDIEKTTGETLVRLLEE